jgi:DNA-binding NarL/FixJ family response regulator
MRSPLVLFLCRSSSLQDSVTSFLSTARPAVTTSAATPAAALARLAGRQPDLVVVDTFRWTGEVTALIAEIKTDWPSARCLVLAGSQAEQVVAKACGVDGVLQWGFLPGQLLVAVQQLVGLPALEKFWPPPEEPSESTH